ncbi:subtilase family protein [Flavobacterium sp. 90]|uniref:S8/S53 family peptidase n=1 Tax=unclassified Flavobacterium TaxID=196869 RepID=UPI000EB1853C|nr:MULTISPECIES: S8/S53 family peptidase [unclassified Flavobacterium]RKR05651.1 subtilase family protein [Flavobacterium sp. 81]TCK56964.1 subtilase family protein [Flavobacterium sp. 90]
MKVVVTANKLNVRKTPVIDFAKKSNVVGVIVKDSIHESTEQHENILGVWHKIEDGWVSDKWVSGDVSSFQPTINKAGVNVQKYIDERFDGTNLKQVIDYNFLLNIPEEIKKTKGINSVIGIIDLPISTNLKFENILRPGNILTEKVPLSHSNFIAGIIGSNATSTIKGICSAATILDLTYNDVNGNLIMDDKYYEKLINCISLFKDTKVIINVSYNIDDSLQFALDKFKDLENVFFVCSAGTNETLRKIDNCPLVNSENAVSVGTASLEFLANNAAKIDSRLNFLLPILGYTSFKGNGIDYSKTNDVSSSWATSVITSIIALLFSTKQLDKNSSKADVLLLIKSLSGNYSDSYSFLNPLKF